MKDLKEKEALWVLLLSPRAGVSARIRVLVFAIILETCLLGVEKRV